MGVDVQLYLPPDVEPRQLAEFFSLKLGAEPVIESSGYGGFWVKPHINLMEAEPSTIAGMTYITFKGGEAYENHVLSHPLQATFHHGMRIPAHMYKSVKPTLKARFGKVWNEVTFTSSPQRLALAREAAKFYGGIVVPADTDWEKFESYSRKMPVDGRGLMPDDDDPYENYNMALFWTKPLFMEDIRAAKPAAAWDKEEKPLSLYPIRRDQRLAIVDIRKRRLDDFVGHGAATFDANDASKRALRRLKNQAGPGKGWWGQPVRHRMAAKKGYRSMSERGRRK